MAIVYCEYGPDSAELPGVQHVRVPTDFSMWGKRQLGGGWSLDTKPYTYSYYNAQYYATQPRVVCRSTQ
jgi:hypothetical protein